MLPGETIRSGAPATCPKCNRKLTAEVLSSAAGYYIGTRCDCGPYSRESGYYPDWDTANRNLKAGTYYR